MSQHLFLQIENLALTESNLRKICEKSVKVFYENSVYVSLQNVKLNDQLLEIVCSYLQNGSFLTSVELNLRENKIGSQGANTVASLISKLPSIRSIKINFWQNQIGDKGLQLFAEKVIQSQHLEQISLNIEDNQISSEGLQIFCETLQKMEQLTALALYIRGNKVDQRGLAGVSKTLKGFKKLINLKLSLCGISMNNQCLEEIYANLNNNKLEKLYLDLQQCKIKDGLGSLGKLLASSAQLHDLYLNLERNAIEQSEIIDLFNPILSNQSNLRTIEINLKANKIGKEGSIELSNTIRKLNATLKSINLALTKIECVDMVNIIDSIMNNMYLQQLCLSLRSQEIRLELIQALGQVLSKPSTLANIKLDLRGQTQLTSELFQEWIPYFKDLRPNLKSLNLDFSQTELQYVEIFELAELILEQQNLHTFVYHHDCGYIQEEIKQSALKNKNLIYFELTNKEDDLLF
ncbi:kinase domain protein (macronuclear) [Tetrahymena thermophila SB210]|uniref:Kinase domain protein n=1 Tax=Tetrahymena thermophila (strain SB210) TaxID=312017 RepID=I7LT69_TETTS|nr:kinase domain protein [Tetrahymena thermophila SB210]EAR84595.2 kinase domain protein [Tetrahymena thermophila SB210]|eukprot:XP_001032258.2 kinase domain protein [Tetrahymena thermophila SB210]